MKYSLEDKEKIEIEYWEKSKVEGPSIFTLDNMLNKMRESQFFYNKCNKYKDIFDAADNILEIGAGQCWASCMLKCINNNKKIYASDISDHAVRSAHYWEHVYNVKLDKVFSCKSYKTNLPDNSVDLVFCFASAHHFVEYKNTLVEVFRILKTGGRCLFLNEPVVSKCLYKLGHYRINKARVDVPEDVIKYNEMLKLGRDIGFNSKIIFDPNPDRNSPIPTLYYYFISKIKILQKILPCAADFIFIKQ